MTYIVQADIENRLGVEIVKDILDDDHDGTVDAAVVAQVIQDAEAYVEGFLRGIYDLDVLRAQGTDCPTEIKRLCLDVATAYLWDRHPEYVRADGAKLRKQTREELMDLRKGVTRLNVVAAPEPAANQGGVTRSGDPDDADVPDPVFIGPDRMGVF